MNWHAAAAMWIVAAILVVLALLAQGTPGAPTAQLSGTLNGSQAATYQLTLSAQIYAVLPPANAIQAGTFVYSITQPNGIGNVTTIAQNQVANFAVTGHPSWDLYIVSATVTFTTTAICSGTNCGGTPMSLTVTAQAIENSVLGSQVGPKATIVFSTNSAQQSIPPIGVPSINGWAFAFSVGILGAVALITGGVALVGPKPILIVTGIDLVVLAAILLWLLLIGGW